VKGLPCYKDGCSYSKAAEDTIWKFETADHVSANLVEALSEAAADTTLARLRSGNGRWFRNYRILSRPEVEIVTIFNTMVSRRT